MNYYDEEDPATLGEMGVVDPVTAALAMTPLTLVAQYLTGKEATKASKEAAKVAAAQVKIQASATEAAKAQADAATKQSAASTKLYTQLGIGAGVLLAGLVAVALISRRKK